jgi:DNA-3-methyladenine glycosylase II
MTPDFIRESLDALGERDPDIARAIREFGYPEPRNREPGFGALIDIIAGQQVSTFAARAIRGRLLAAVDPLTPENFLAASDETLRAVGLSRRKVEYGRGIAEAMRTGALDADRLADAADDDVIAALTALRGLGRWSAEIYMLFALRRPDVWPAEDLAIQEALRRLKGLDERPLRKQSEPIVEAWRPVRGVAALFLWHYYKGVPVD